MEKDYEICKKGKHCPRFIWPYKLLERVGQVEYKLDFPPELDKIHNVLHVSMIRRYHYDQSDFLLVESIEVNLELIYNEKPILIKIEK